MCKLYKSFLSLLSGLLLLSSCNNQEELGGLQPDDTSLPPYSVTFRLGGSVAPGAAATRVQTDDEKKLYSLYAVVFEDADGAGTGTTGTEAAADKFYAAFPVDLDGYNKDPQDNPVLSFSLAKAGHFQVCFVANPSGHADDAQSRTGLAQAISNLQLGTSTVAQFKALLESGVLDAAKAPSQYLMTSPFYTLATSYTDPQTIGEVVLTRAMARFDIINAADGYTITQVVFHNRATKTPVMADTPAYDDKNVTATTEYNMELVGNSTPDAAPKCEATIYSFEQYAGSDQDFSEGIAGLPYLEVKYKMPSVSDTRIYSHNVYFRKAKEQPAEGYDVLPIKRNTLYTVKMTNDTHSNLNFTITVMDWDKNTEIAVGDDVLVDGVTPALPKPLEEAAIGDYYMKDGTLRQGMKRLSEEDLPNVIGIVFQTDQSRIGDVEKSTLQSKGITAHGLVMAVKLANNGQGCVWSINKSEDTALSNIGTVQAAYQDINGLSNYNTLPHTSDYPAFQAVDNFDVPTPETSTGWYLPSSGQLWDIAANLGELKSDMDSYKDCPSENPLYFQFKVGAGSSDDSQVHLVPGFSPGQFLANINAYLSNLDDKVQLFSDGSLWSSSEYSESSVCNSYFGTNYFDIDHDNKNEQYHLFYVRPVLAF